MVNDVLEFEAEHAFGIEVRPKAWERPRFNKNGTVYETKAFKEYKQKIVEAAKLDMCGRPPYDVPVKVWLDFHKKSNVVSRTFGDIDNLTKAVLDAFNGIVYTDDRLIVELHVAKHYDAEENIIWVGINPVDEE